MGSQRVELIQEGFEAWNRGDRSWVLEHMSPDAEWITPPSDPEPGHYRGHDEIQGFWDQWRAAVGQLTFEVEELIESEDDVMVVCKRSGKGEQSGLAVSDRVVQVFTFSGSTCVKVQEFYDRDEALKSTRSSASIADGSSDTSRQV